MRRGDYVFDLIPPKRRLPMGVEFIFLTIMAVSAVVGMAYPWMWLLTGVCVLVMVWNQATS